MFIHITDLKIKHCDSDTNFTDNPPITDSIKPNENKKTLCKRYKPENTGPYKVVTQDKNNQKINLLTIGKIIKQNYCDIDHITQTGKTLLLVIPIQWQTI